MEKLAEIRVIYYMLKYNKCHKQTLEIISGVKLNTGSTG